MTRLPGPRPVGGVLPRRRTRVGRLGGAARDLAVLRGRLRDRGLPDPAARPARARRRRRRLARHAAAPDPARRRRRRRRCSPPRRRRSPACSGSSAWSSRTSCGMAGGTASHGFVVPVSALGGAALLVAGDTLARTVKRAARAAGRAVHGRDRRAAVPVAAAEGGLMARPVLDESAPPLEVERPRGGDLRHPDPARRRPAHRPRRAGRRRRAERRRQVDARAQRRRAAEARRAARCAGWARTCAGCAAGARAASARSCRSARASRPA